MLNLAWVQTFLALARSKSFQGAAVELKLAQPTVSQQIQKLEGRLGVLLVHRGRSGCELTEAGVAFLPYAKSLLRLIDRARAELAGGSIRVGASSNIGVYLLQPHVKSFLSGRDPASLDLVIDRNPAIEQMLVDGEVDIAIMEWWQAREGFVARRWRSEPLVLIVPPDHPLALRTSVDKEELAGLALLGGETGTGTGRLLSNYLDGSALPRMGMQLGSTEAVKQAVKAGIGISLVFESAVTDEVRNGTICAIRLADAVLAKDLFVAWSIRSEQSNRHQTFVEHLLRDAPAVAAQAGLRPAGAIVA